MLQGKYFITATTLGQSWEIVHINHSLYPPDNLGFNQFEGNTICISRRLQSLYTGDLSLVPNLPHHENKTDPGEPITNELFQKTTGQNMHAVYYYYGYITLLTLPIQKKTEPGTLYPYVEGDDIKLLKLFPYPMDYCIKGKCQYSHTLILTTGYCYIPQGNHKIYVL